MKDIAWDKQPWPVHEESLAQIVARDEAVAKRGTPSMPKLAFMNGTKWGREPGDDEPAAVAA